MSKTQQWFLPVYLFLSDIYIFNSVEHNVLKKRVYVRVILSSHRRLAWRQIGCQSIRREVLLGNERPSLCALPGSTVQPPRQITEKINCVTVRNPVMDPSMTESTRLEAREIPGLTVSVDVSALLEVGLLLVKAGNTPLPRLLDPWREASMT